MKKGMILLITMLLLIAASGNISAASFLPQDDTFEYEGVEKLPKKEVGKAFGQLHRQDEFTRSINRMKERNLRIDMKHSAAYEVERFENVRFNEIQEDVEVYKFAYTSNKGKEGYILIVYKDCHIIENGTSIYSVDK